MIFFYGNPVNPELANILMKLGLIEQSGKGINTIVNHYGENVFNFADNYLQVNLPYNKAALNTCEYDNEDVNDNVNENVNTTENVNENVNTTENVNENVNTTENVNEDDKKNYFKNLKN